MGTHEPGATALLLLVFGALLAASVLFSRASERLSVPVALVFLVIGMLAGSDGIGGIAFEDYGLAFRLGTVALVLILFDGGLNTPLQAVRLAGGPAAVLATIGVLGTAGVLAAGARALGFSWPEAMLIGAVVSSTDAAAVFAVLRGSGLHLKRRVGTTLELESGLNDPAAVILTTVITAHLLAPGSVAWWRVPFSAAGQLVLGSVIGLAVGYLGRWVLARMQLRAASLYAAFSLALACLAFGLGTALGGSGFLAVYVAGVVLGNGPLPYRAGLFRVHDALAWLGQITMFLLLGLLVFPSRLPDVGGVGLALAAVLAFVARPAIVALCLWPFRYHPREILYVGWVGLRGAVPIVLATFPVLAGAPGAERVFNVVFFIVVASALVPGSTVAWVTRRLGLERHEPPPPPAVLAVESRQVLRSEVVSFVIAKPLAVVGVAIGELPMPEGTVPILLVRGDELLAPRPDTVLTPGDHLYLVARPEDRAMLHLLFGPAEAGDESA
ncbi:MAG TPA: potassium/proton antiporter [Gemmatimonadales bacterium]|nr:potassium/proton antiporter [Gemmatimonadales bacterium]